MAEGGHPGAFVHLRVRSAYSLLEGAIKANEIGPLAAKAGMPAAAITDRANLFGALEFSQYTKDAGVQPIIGCALPVSGIGEGPPERWARCPTVVLLAQNEAGWLNLMSLSSTAYLESESPDDAAVPWETVVARSQGLILLSGGPDGPVNPLFAAGKAAEGRAVLDAMGEAFGDRFYVELQRHGRPIEAAAEPGLVAWAYDNDVALVATNDVYFDKADMHVAHDALLCIAEGAFLSQEDRRRVTAEHYFKTGAAMRQTFADLPEACDTTLEIARRCAFMVNKRDPILPSFSTGAGRSEPEELAHQAREGLRARLASTVMAAPEQDYWDRLEREIGVITAMGFPGYFLIVSDFIKWSKAHEIPVGPGRGSGAGSMVAWALSITGLDPLRFGLLFERFLNPERVSMPDFDIDFCQERREEVIAYVQERYGRDRVAQIITFGTLQARAVLRDVGRVMQLPLGLVDRLAKMVPNNPAAPVTLAQAIEIEPRLKQAKKEDPSVANLLEVALRLEGLFRNASTHAAGVVIGDRDLTELAPLYKDPRSPLPATQFNMKWVESAGLVKFDFLGLKTLTVLDRAVRHLRKRGAGVDLDALPLDDARTYELLASGQGVGVFQLESQGMRDTLRKLRCGSIEEITALISLYRPGPMDNIDTYVDRKFGRAEVDMLHPSLEPVLKETNGVIIYQEQVMQIAQILAGYSLGEADLLRRAGGPFLDLFDFLERIDPKSVNKRALENLARAGAFDRLHPNRAQIVEAADTLIAYAQAKAAERVSDQASLFGGEDVAAGRPRLPKTEAWIGTVQLDEELAAVGFYLTGHPLEDVVELLRRKRVVLCAEALALAEDGQEAFRMAGMVRRRQERASQSGEKFAFVSLSDPTGEYEVLFPPESLRRCREFLEPGQAVTLKVRAKAKDGEVRFFGDDAEPLERAIESVAAGLRVHLAAAAADMTSLKKRLDPALNAKGGEVILVAGLGAGQEVELKLPGRFMLDAALRGALKTSPGVVYLEDV